MASRIERFGVLQKTKSKQNKMGSNVQEKMHELCDKRLHRARGEWLPMDGVALATPKEKNILNN